MVRSFPPAQRQAYLGAVRPVRRQDDGRGQPLQRVLRGDDTQSAGAPGAPSGDKVRL